MLHRATRVRGGLFPVGVTDTAGNCNYPQTVGPPIRWTPLQQNVPLTIVLYGLYRHFFFVAVYFNCQ